MNKMNTVRSSRQRNSMTLLTEMVVTKTPTATGPLATPITTSTRSQPNSPRTTETAQ